MANESLEVAIGEDGNGSSKLIDAINRLTLGMEKLADASDKGAKGVKKEGEEAKAAAAGNNTLAGSVDKAKAGFGALASALSGVTALLSASKLIAYADQYDGISQKLKLVTTDQAKLNAIIETSYGIAQRNSTGLANTAKLYGQLSAVYKGLGKDQSLVAKTTETITQAISLTGPSAEEAANGLGQFNQGLSSGVLRGDEFNSVMENTPGLAKAIAAGFSSAGPITTGELRKMAEEGKLTGKALTEALERAAPNIAILAGTSVDTVAEAFTRLENATLKFVGQTNQAYGVTALLAKGIDLIAKNIGPAILALTAFIAILAVGALAGAVNSILALTGGFTFLTGAINLATVAMLRNPLILAGTLAAVTATLVVMRATGVTFGDIAAKLNQVTTSATGAITGTTGIGTASATATPALTGLATATGTASSATASLTAANTAAPAAAALATTAYGGLIGSATKVGTALADVSGRAKAIPVDIAAAASGAATAALGFGTLQLNASSTAAGIAAVSAAALLLNPALGAVNGALTNSGIQMQTTSASAYKLADAKLRINNAGSALGPTLQKIADATKGVGDANSSTTKTAEEARQAMEAQTKATEEGKKAADAFASALEKLGGNFNSMGEKIETATEAMARFKSAADKAKKAIKDAADNLKQYYTAADSANGVTRDFGVTVGDVTRASTSYSSSLYGVASSYDRVAASAENASRKTNQFSLDSVNAAQQAAQSRSGVNRSGDSVTVTAGNTDGSNNSYGVSVYSVGGIDVGASNSPDLQSKTRGMSEAQQMKYSINGWNLYLARNQFETTGPNFDPASIWRGFVFGGGQDALVNKAKPTETRGFAHGGSFMVGGMGGTDSQPVSFMASPNERVTIETPAQQIQRDNADNVGTGRKREQPVNIVMNVKTDDVDSFKRSKKQIAQDMFGRLGRAI